jgi:type IV secretion system protein VirD4
MSAAAAVAMATRALRTLGHLLLPAWMAGHSLPDSHGASRWAKASDLRPLMGGRTSSARQGDGIVIGWLGGRLLQAPPEDSVLAFGVQRSGKTSTLVVPSLLSWMGAAVATSTKEELVRLTAGARRDRPVWVFAPIDEDHQWCRDLGLEPASWNPLESTSTAAQAGELADHFTHEGKRGASAHWYLAASGLLTGLFLHERGQGGDMRSVLARLNNTKATRYASLAAGIGDPTTSELLTAISETPEKEAGSIISTARSSLSLWVDDRVVAATRSTSRQIDLDRLLAEAGTLYLVAPAEEAERCRPLFSALLQTLLRKATSRARQQGGALSPRLLLALDEAGNFTRIPRLTAYVSSGPGQGIQLLLCFHDLAQLQAAYGLEEARTIWNNCRARVLLPGQGDLQTLELFSRAIGDETRHYQSSSHDDRRTSHSEQRVGRPLVTVDELRRMTSALLLYANAPPAPLQLRRWDQVPAWRALVQR